MKECFQIKDKFFDMIVKAPSRDGFKNFLRESCGELDNIDFKERWISKGKLAKIMLAIANTGGGAIVFGIKENKGENYVAEGLDELKDAADVEKEIKKFVPRNLSYHVLEFIYDDQMYGEYVGKKFQVIIIEDTPEQLPFFSLAKSDEIEKDIVYVRRGTSSEKASSQDLEKILQRRLENIFKEGNCLSLKEHLEQLQFLYDNIPQKKRILVKKGDRYTGVYAGLQALSECMSELFGSNDEYEEVSNDNYPSEDYEQFLVRMIEKKKLKIEKVLDLI